MRLETSFSGSKVILEAIATIEDEAVGMIVLVVKKDRMMSDFLSGYVERSTFLGKACEASAKTRGESVYCNTQSIPLAISRTDNNYINLNAEQTPNSFILSRVLMCLSASSSSPPNKYLSPLCLVSTHNHIIEKSVC